MKLTKGRQKIKMTKVESYAARVATFSKRKSGILKKMNEIALLCDVETAFLFFSETGKPFTFAYPSLKEAFGRFDIPLRHETFESINVGPLVEAYKRQQIQVLMQRYVDLVEEFEIQNRKENILKKSREEKKEEMWWITPTEGLSMEARKSRCQTFVDLHVQLELEGLKRFGNDGEGSFSSQESCGRDGETYA